MTKWIRWSGLAGFLIIVGLIAALVVLALPMAIRFTIEFVGSKVAGAEVSVADVDVGLSPLGVTLRDVQVADARQPMQNLVQFDTATADLELAPLLVGKAISQQLVVDNLQFHTERTTSGALPVSDEAEESNEPGIKEKTLEALPSVDEVLARETLKTPAAGKALSESWETQSQAVEAAMAEVPDKAALSRYRTEIEEITSGRLESIEDFRQRKARLDALKAQFKKDKQAVEAARAAVTSGKQEVSDRLAELKRAPGEDLTYLKDKYQLSGTGVSNLTGLLFGDDAANWAREALYWYERIQPYLSDDGSEDDSQEVEEEKQARLAGEFVHFLTDNPWPDFLIREARLSGPFDGGSLVIRGQDITHQQKVTGRATVFTATGEQLQKIGDLDARLTLDHTGQRGRDSLNVAVSDWAMAPVALGVAGAELSQAKVQLTSQAVVEGGVLAADLKAKVRQATFDGDGQTLFARELNSALKGISQFSVNATAEGKLSSPAVTFGSDLDRQINAALSQRLNAKQDEFEARLQKRLNQQVAEYAGDYADELQSLIDMEGSLSDRLNSLTELASTQLEDFKAQQEREAKEKIAAEKAEAEAKAKAEADARKQDLKNKAKNQLKSLF
jgi:uncharacterized protein (TIGR03545 family)